MTGIGQAREGYIKTGNLRGNETVYDLAQRLISSSIYQSNAVLRRSCNNDGGCAHGSTIMQANALCATILIFDSLDTRTTHDTRTYSFSRAAQPLHEGLPA